MRANEGWVPKNITRKLSVGGKLSNTRDYNMTKLETGPPVLKKWFADRVSEPTFVTDFRYHGLTVHCFTRDKLLSDEEVKRRAKAIAGQNRPLRFPGSPWKTAGIGLILLGAVLLIWKVGWSRKQSGQSE